MRLKDKQLKTKPRNVRSPEQPYNKSDQFLLIRFESGRTWLKHRHLKKYDLK